MRFFAKFPALCVICSVVFCLSLTGCEGKAEVEGPEMGSIEAYLEENPEERLDDPDDAGDEGEEFDASGS